MDNEDYAIAYFKQKKVIQSLENLSGNHTSLISILIPPGTQISKVSTLITQELGTASSIKSRQTRQSVEEALTVINGKVKNLNWLPDNGLCIYCGLVKTDVQGKTERVLKLVEPIKPVPQFIYRCDTHFIIDPLKDQLESHEKYGFIVVDGAGALFASLCGNAQNILHKFSVSLPKKHNKGGQSSNRFAHLRTEARHNYITKVLEIARKTFISTQDPNKLNVKGIVLAGSADFKEVLRGRLDGPLAKGVLGMVDISYGGEQGFAEAIEQASEILRRVSIMHHKKLLTKFFEKIAQDNTDVIFGVEYTMDALENSAVDTLIIWEQLPVMRHLIRDPQSLAEKVVYTKNQETAPSLPKGETGQSWEIVQSELLVDWVAENYRDFKIRLEMVHDSSAEGSQFCKGFGGLGAILRYAYTPESSVTNSFGNEENPDDDDLYGDVWDTVGNEEYYF